MFRLSLPDDPARAVLLGVKMAWETPNYSEHRMTAGIGFAFDACDTAEEIKQRAERLLTDMPLNTPNFTI
jgi:Tfp pilus assembly protein PilZ